ncbi:MAG: hypothetical protein PHV40_04890 [Candidatus Omnitrophica bacterium]|nr:hypothetical protein [Candidatus Omnitrophota bacterium]
MLKKVFCAILLVMMPAACWAMELWERQNDLYFLAKNKINFALPGAGPNLFAQKFLQYDGIKFLVKGPAEWKDYGRLNLEGNNIFVMPIKEGFKVNEVHFLAGGNYSNSYEHDSLMRLFGDKYFYSTLSIILVYEDGIYKEISAPIFWDWFRIGRGTWSRGGATVISLGENPVREKCSMFHISFLNPWPNKPLKSILVTDSWISDKPFSDVFAVTLKSSDIMEGFVTRR